MSTYCFLICEQHKESVGASSRIAAGSTVVPLVSGEIAISRFIYYHRHCQLTVQSEVEFYDRDDLQRWDDDNWEKLLKRDNSIKS